MLGFQVLDPFEVAHQRKSRLSTHISNISRDRVSQKLEIDDIECDGQDVVSNRGGAKLDSQQSQSSHLSTLAEDKPAFHIELVLNSDDEVTRQMKELDTEFYKYREERMAINLTMTHEQVKKVQLQKLYRLALQLQKLRVRDLMVNVMRQAMMQVEKREIIEQFIKQSSDQSLMQFKQTQVEMMFKNWAPDLNDIPLSMRENVARLCRPKTFQLHDKVIDFADEEQSMYLIVEGSAVLFHNSYSLNKFEKQLKQVRQEQKDKAVLLRKPNFNHVV